MKIRLLDWKGESHYVEIPDDTKVIGGEIISGDMVITYPIFYDTGKDTRIMHFHDGTFTIDEKDFDKLELIERSYQVFELDQLSF